MGGSATWLGGDTIIEIDTLGSFKTITIWTSGQADCIWNPMSRQRKVGGRFCPWASLKISWLDLLLLFNFLALRTSTRTLGLCCLSSMDCTVCRQVVRIFELSWWTISYHGQSRCISSMTSKAQHTKGELPKKSERNLSLPLKIWTSYKTSLMGSFWMPIYTMLYARPCSVTVW